MRLAWSPDRAWIAMRGSLGHAPNQQFGIHLIDPEKGATGKLLQRQATHSREQRSIDQVGDIAWLDERTIVFSSAAGVNTIDIANGSEHRVWTAPLTQAVDALALSPDRRSLALSLRTVQQPAGHEVKVISTAGSLTNQALHEGAIGFVQSWSADGRAVLVTRPSVVVPNQTELWRVPIDGTAPTQMPIAGQQLYEVKASPDGKRLAVTVHSYRREFFVGLGR